MIISKKIFKVFFYLLFSTTVYSAEQRGPYLGKDWAELVTIQEKFPAAIAINYQQAIAREAAYQRLPHSTRLKQRSIHHRDQAAVIQQKQLALQQLSDFRKSIEGWLHKVQVKVDLGLISSTRNPFLMQMIHIIRQSVLPNLHGNGLLIFHKALHQVQAYDRQTGEFSRIPFNERFLKPKYAEAFRQEKIRFYSEQQRQLMAKINALRPSSQNDPTLQALRTQLWYVESHLQKWRDRQIDFAKRPIKIFPLDEAMGIQNIKDLGYKGRGVKIAVIEPQAEELLTIPHHALQKRIAEGSAPLAKIHGTHVSGIIAARAETVMDRLGIAPKANILYLHAPPSSGTRLLFLSEKNTAASSIKTVVNSEAATENDKKMAALIEKLTAQEIKIINTSMVYSVGQKTLTALKNFARRGGVIIKAAGNAGIAISPFLKLDPTKLTQQQQYQTAIDLGLFKAVMADPELRRAYIFVGNMNSQTTLSPTSNRAGFLAERFIAAWGTDVPSTIGYRERQKLSGTSMAAPMVTGALALLVEAFPNCGPQALAQNLLETATPLEPTHEFGRGRLNLSAAFELSEKSCGLATPPQRKSS
jgi:subtilisin family serine protease